MSSIKKPRSLRCKYCWEEKGKAHWLKNKTAHRRHILAKHPSYYKKTWNKTHDCPKCQKRFYAPYLVKKHEPHCYGTHLHMSATSNQKEIIGQQTITSFMKKNEKDKKDDGIGQPTADDISEEDSDQDQPIVYTIPPPTFCFNDPSTRNSWEIDDMVRSQPDNKVPHASTTSTLNILDWFTLKRVCKGDKCVFQHESEQDMKAHYKDCHNPHDADTPLNMYSKLAYCCDHCLFNRSSAQEEPLISHINQCHNGLTCQKMINLVQ